MSYFRIPDCDVQRLRKKQADGIREGRHLLRSGSRTIDVMRKSWNQELIGSPYARAFAAGMQDAVAHQLKMDSRSLPT